MHRQNMLALGLLAAVAIVVVTVGYAKGWGPLGVISKGVERVTGSSESLVPADRFVSDDKIGSANESPAAEGAATEKKSPVAPEFAEGTWVNSEPLTLKGLKGRVVVVDFWTFGCYNCRNTLPSLKSWDDRYRDKGLTIVGVHSPEFDSEHKVENVKREVSSLGIRYPVVTDNDYETWRAYNVEAWPTLFVLDKSGRVRWMHVGEGAYEETRQVIEKLLAE